MHNSGGRVSTVIAGVTYSARGAIKLDPSNISVSVGVNQDGTPYRTVTPKARTAEISLDSALEDDSGSPLVWDETIMLLTNLQITFIEEDIGLTHLLTGGCFTGSPAKDLSTGEVDGLGLAATSYKTIAS